VTARRVNNLSSVPKPAIDGYRELVEKLGGQRVADLILLRWLNDTDAEHKWDRLLDDMEREERPWPYNW
jgi:hypothetical protein